MKVKLVIALNGRTTINYVCTIVYVLGIETLTLPRSVFHQSILAYDDLQVVRRFERVLKVLP